jgi:hypothetical protein
MALHPDDPRNVGLTEDELTWCRTNQHLPEAREVLALYASKFVGDTILKNDQDLSQAVWRLRQKHGRPPVKLDALYAYLHVRPPDHEDVAAYQEEGPKGPTTHFMVGGDFARMRAYQDAVAMFEKGGQKLELVRFDRGERIGLDDIARMPDRISRVELVFAVLNVRERGDEGIAVYHREPWGVLPMIFTRKESIRDAIPYIETFSRLAEQVEIRTFVNRQPATLPAIEEHSLGRSSVYGTA